MQTVRVKSESQTMQAKSEMQTKQAKSEMQTKPTKSIFWGIVRLLENNFLMAATDEGLCYLQFHEADHTGGVDEGAWLELVKWARAQLPEPNWVEDTEKLQPYIHQLEEYLKGLRTTFTLPLDLRGTTFQQSVWRVLHEIPHGETCSYSQVAQELDKISAVRAVGTAIGANPVLIVVPCHRVVGKDGSLTGYRGGLRNKEKLLLLERAGL
ncbi:methylated-DNA-[protein]-cysteine S-methyltransferase [Paenibacillus sp. V4I3]|uniref:methylated-DNA--[protein]-cysteine S-methyltransferase n=1 Tax=unclassified Paenibacillus TaxID=185978 RepID=UPI002785573D|nr:MULTISPECIES: methylated-DNA--[protein]-cysteine S-methyltransferase [unclassified Paenibacillus]MDQ0872842.1 methylated-DNA-[protein]-cysteine S-methyltransferase [Paenibacillus sp. V4I3]MDQ0891241.1 methylated-DNA-[protein]-cysteine S-methyltransferase [Paenibacillus sp. V4I9]